MSIALKCSACGHEKQFDQLAEGNLPSCPACGNQSLPSAQRKPAVFRVSASDVIAPSEPELPRLQTYEELGIHDIFRKAVGEELTRDEQMLWLGRPSCLSILALAFPLDRGGMMKVHQDTTARLFSLQHTPRRHTLGVCPIVPNR